ncbi:m-AAA protease-interacting protein 1, mitochondrial-like isoform X2 [Xenia sp. Carnegie-2017]|uniref:m-AAA protease-interacting protein 1, mitochondrial-like isoform X2 n=1 Tax=Xenia sp. Carnegie-2017 TaxID=2897299 RepID=UPI001F04235A|nr:m-AAA protease-interacting protein 1, mitochondrial-like isoform X2 [Xenia sp. Carnegie-2017]
MAAVLRTLIQQNKLWIDTTSSYFLRLSSRNTDALLLWSDSRNCSLKFLQSFQVSNVCKICGRRFFSSSSNKQNESKRALSIVITRGPFKWLSNKVKLFLVNSYFDKDFEEKTFLEGAKQAIITVSALVYERKFDLLKGLLTDNAINDVKKQIEDTDTIESYCVTSDNIIQTNIHDIGFRYDEKEKGRKWLYVMVSCIYHEYNVQADEISSIGVPLPRIIRYRCCFYVYTTQKNYHGLLCIR